MRPFGIPRDGRPRLEESLVESLLVDSLLPGASVWSTCWIKKCGFSCGVFLWRRLVLITTEPPRIGRVIVVVLPRSSRLRSIWRLRWHKVSTRPPTNSSTCAAQPPMRRPGHIQDTVQDVSAQVWMKRACAQNRKLKKDETSKMKRRQTKAVRRALEVENRGR